MKKKAKLGRVIKFIELASAAKNEDLVLLKLSRAEKDFCRKLLQQSEDVVESLGKQLDIALELAHKLKILVG